MRRVILGLNAATVLLVLMGIALLVVPAPVPTGLAPAVVASTGALPDSVRPISTDPGAADRVVRTDIFSSRRAPPSRRSTFGETSDVSDAALTEMISAATLAGEPMDSSGAATANDAVPHLYGTMMGPNESTALLRLDAAMSEPRLYRVGDRAGRYRVAGIADRSVTLIGPNGRVVLRLAKPGQ
jgi:hypothetical protein